MTPRPRRIAGRRPITAKSPPPDVQARARTNGGAASTARKQAPLTPAQRWAAAVDGVIERFKADMKQRYVDELDNPAEGTPE